VRPGFARRPWLISVLALSACGFAMTGCGYQVAGKANLLPADIHTIAVIPWGNATTRFGLSNYLATSVSHELIARTRYKVVSDPAKADAILSGSVANMYSGATVFDPTTSRSTGAQITVQLQVHLVDRFGKVLFNQPNLEFRERYQVSTDPKQYFDESEAAMQRLSNDVAKTVVSAVLEKF
jgi:Lipopolysaccharide-assembly